MEKLYKSILIYGPPGAGKGTVSKVLSLSDSVFHLSTGAIFRSIEPNSEKGKMIKGYIDKGNLLPDGLTIDLWHEFVVDKINKKEFNREQYLLLDGIPRTIKQAVLLEKYIQVEHIIVLEISNIEKLITRLKNRAKIEGRIDDLDDNALRKRMDIYLQDTTKILKHYPQSKIFNFNADQKKLEVIKDVLLKFADL